MAKEREKFSDIAMESTIDVCDMRRAADREERGVNGGMKKWVAEERAFEEWLHKRDGVTYPLKRYRTQSGCETGS